MNINMIWLFMALSIMAGAGLSEKITFSVEYWTPAALSLCLFVIFFLKLRKWKCLIFIIFSFLYGFVSIQVSQDKFLHSSWRLPGKIIIMKGEVISFPEKAFAKYKWQFRVDQFRMEEGSWYKTKSKVEVFVPATEETPVIGDRLVLKGQIRFPHDNEYGAERRKRNLFLKNIEAQIRVKKVGDLINDGWNYWTFPLRLLQLMRESGSDYIEKTYKPEQSAVLKALLFGMHMTDPSLRVSFSRTGTSHLLSVSGFHTAVVATIVFSVLVLFRFSPARAAFGASGITIAYVILTGWGIATQRAGMMAILVWVAWVMGRPQKLIYWLNMTMAILLWIEPKKVWDISFQLSFLSMYGLLLVAPLLKNILKIPGLDISVAASLATYPVVLFHFQNFSCAGIFVNLVAVPAFALILPLGILSLIPILGYPAAILTRLLLNPTLGVLKKTADQSWACLTFQQPSMQLIFIYYFFGGIILWHCRQSKAAP